MTLKKSRLDYKWVILILCFLMEFVCLGFCSSNTGLYTKAVTEALDVKRSIYSLSTSLRYAVQVLVSLNFGMLIHRFGIKKMVCFGMLSLTGSVLIRGLATNIYHIYIGSALWGMGIVFSGGIAAGTIVQRWFQKDVGRYTGIVMSANGIGGAVAAQIISPLINNGETFGYRKAYMLSAAISLAISIVIIFFMRERPDDSAVVFTSGKKKPKSGLWKGIPYEVVRKRAYFYVTAVLVFITGISLQSVGNSTLVYMADIGLKPGFIAATATVSSLSLTFSKILIGIAYDKQGLRKTLLFCLMAAMTGFLLNALLTNTIAGSIMAITATVLAAIAIPLETVMLPLIASDLYGAASYTKVLGIFMAMNSLGLCLGSPLGDLCYDIFGTYKPSFWVFTGILAAVAVAYLFVIRAAYRDKQAILSETESVSA